MSNDQPKPPESENSTPEAPSEAPTPTADSAPPSAASAPEAEASTVDAAVPATEPSTIEASISPEASIPDASTAASEAAPVSESADSASEAPPPEAAIPDADAPADPGFPALTPEVLSTSSTPDALAPEAPATPEPTAPPKSIASTGTKAPEPPPTKLQAVGRLLKQLWGIWLAILPVLVEQVRKLWQLTLVLLKWIGNGWAFLLPRIRPLLPEPLKTQLPNQVLTAIAITILLLSVWITTTLFSDRPSIAKTPSPTATPDSPPAQVAPTPKPPDPGKIAAIQEQVAKVTDQYSEGLIQAVQANFDRSRLIVKVGGEWYSLEPPLQDKLANDVLKRSRKLKFDKLELTDSEGTLLARSPVVGSNMLILQRQFPSEATPPEPEEQTAP